MTLTPGTSPCGGWDDPETAARYRRFELKHGRYRRANAALARHAALKPGLKVRRVAPPRWCCSSATPGWRTACAPRSSVCGSKP